MALCDPLVGPGGPTCSRVYAPNVQQDCLANASSFCQVVAGLGTNSSAPGNSQGGGWGIIVSILCDIFISVGLALQKTGHNRVLRLEAQGIKSSILRQPVWVLGLVGMISGEVGNLAAYGDPGTPAAVITAVGCVGVVANLFIATLFLKEPFRYRDLMGSTLVVGGVCLLSIFKLEPEAPLTGERLNMMLYSPGAIGVYCVYGGSILFFLLTIKRIGDIHVIFYLLLSSFIGAFTVISAKPVSTFVIKSFNGIFSGTFSDVLVDKGVKLDDGTWKFSPYAILSAMECAEYDPISVALGFDGTKWVKLQNTADAEILSGRSNALEGCYHRGTGELHQPAFWIFIVILIATAIAQVKYLNDALARFDNSEVIPTHYVCFTLLSVTGATVVYQEWHIPMHAETGCSMIWRAHLFLDGMMCTILGVYFITTMRGAKRPKGSQSIIDGDDDFDDDPIPPPMASISEESATNNTPVTAVTIGSSGGSNVEQVKLKLGTSTEPGEGTPLKGDESAPNTPSRISDRPPSLISSQSSSNNRLIERRGSALGDLKRQGSSGMFPGLELAPVPAPAPLADAEAAPSAQAPPYRASSSTGSRISTKQKSRQSFVEQVAAVLPIPQLSGIDARSPAGDQTTARTSNYLALLGGPRSASTFMFDPADREDTPAQRESRRSVRGERGSVRLDITGDFQHRAIQFPMPRASFRGRSGTISEESKPAREPSTPDQVEAAGTNAASSSTEASAAEPRLSVQAEVEGLTRSRSMTHGAI